MNIKEETLGHGNKEGTSVWKSLPIRENTARQSKKRKMSDSEIPVTIAMPEDLLFKKEQLGPMIPGPLNAFVKALKAVNNKLREHYPDSKELFRVLLIRNNSSDSLERAIREHEMENLITLKAVGGGDLTGELERENTHLYLAAEQSQAEEAGRTGIASAAVFIPEKMEEVSESVLRVVFDGDAVLFSNESELVFKKGLLQAFLDHEKEKVEIQMKEGPLKGFLEALERVKGKIQGKNCPIRTYLVTSRGAGCDGYRALNTLHIWGLEMDEAVFLGGANKGPTLAKIKPHIFFDDQMRHVNAALEVGTLACMVPDGSREPEKNNYNNYRSQDM